MNPCTKAHNQTVGVCPYCERDAWKAAHDNQVNLRRMLMDRPDLKDRAKRISEVIVERDAAKASEAECLRQWNEYEADTSREIAALKELNKKLAADLADALTRLSTAEQHLSGKSPVDGAYQQRVWEVPCLPPAQP